MVFHFGITEAAHDGQQVGPVDVGDSELVPEDLGRWVMAMFVIDGVASVGAAREEQQGECETAGRDKRVEMIAPIEQHMRHCLLV